MAINLESAAKGLLGANVVSDFARHWRTLTNFGKLWPNLISFVQLVNLRHVIRASGLKSDDRCSSMRSELQRRGLGYASGVNIAIMVDLSE